MRRFSRFGTICAKRGKHPWRSITFNKLVGYIAYNFTKSNTPPWVFFTFFNCANGTKSHNVSHMKRMSKHRCCCDKREVWRKWIFCFKFGRIQFLILHVSIFGNAVLLLLLYFVFLSHILYRHRHILLTIGKENLIWILHKLQS